MCQIVLLLTGMSTERLVSAQNNVRKAGGRCSKTPWYASIQKMNSPMIDSAVAQIPRQSDSALENQIYAGGADTTPMSVDHDDDGASAGASDHGGENGSTFFFLFAPRMAESRPGPGHF